MIDVKITPTYSGWRVAKYGHGPICTLLLIVVHNLQPPGSSGRYFRSRGGIMKFWFGCFGAALSAPAAHAATLHFGAAAVELTPVRYTSPSLAVQMTDGTYWGALYNDNAPGGTLRINVGGTKYWLGAYCAPGTYLAAGATGCVDCGLGHFCMGGRHRAPCSGGIIACPTTRASADADAPTMVNRVLTADEINANVPPTKLSQWHEISCCSTPYDDYYHTLNNDWSAINRVNGCAGGTLAAGTYLFTVRTGTFCSTAIDPFDGLENAAYSAHIAIYDHAVSYKTIHANSIYYHFLDTRGPVFTAWNTQIPINFCQVDIRANVDGLANVPRTMCVYVLK